MNRTAHHFHPTLPPSLATGQRLRHIVDVAVKQRRFLAKNGKGMAVDLTRLKDWLERNPFPSQSTAHSFPLLGDLLAAMPHHAAGRKMLDEVRQMTAYSPLTNSTTR